MKEERNIHIDGSNSIAVREYVSYLERKDAIKRSLRKEFWFGFLDAFSYIVIGAGISTIILLASIGLDVVL